MNCRNDEERIDMLTKEKEECIQKFYEKCSKDEDYFSNIINNLKRQIEDLKGSILKKLFRE